jgi:Orotidine 5'-phosphate decarboxylase / HUMPS family
LFRNVGALIVAEMSCAGSLAVGSYTTSCVTLAGQHKDLVAGLVAQSRLSQVSAYSCYEKS